MKERSFCFIVHLSRLKKKPEMSNINQHTIYNKKKKVLKCFVIKLMKGHNKEMNLRLGRYILPKAKSRVKVLPRQNDQDSELEELPLPPHSHVIRSYFPIKYEKHKISQAQSLMKETTRKI